MKSQIENLLEKYWEGETTLEEERLLKKLLAKGEGYGTEKAFFYGVEEISKLEETPFTVQRPRENPWISNWMRIAAGLILFLASGLAINQYQKQKAEKEAFQEVMQAFTLINSHLEKGANSMHVMQEFKHLNTTQELFKTKEKN